MKKAKKPSFLSARALETTVRKAVDTTPIYDVHTHLYDPKFGELLLWGIDELLTYHYLVAEVFRYLDMPYDDFWKMSKTAQADLIWDKLFIQNSPISEACRGVITTLNELGLDVKKRDLPKIRQWFARQKPDKYLDLVLKTSNVHTIAMTNSPFDELEAPLWRKGFNRDPRFKACLRLDPILMQWEQTSSILSGWGYDVQKNPDQKTYAEVRRFLADWTRLLDPLYLAVSLPPSFQYPEDSVRGRLIENCILPHCRENNLPFAPMIGVNKLVNPQLRLAGDCLGKCSITALENFCARNPENKFFVTVLSRENQHELCVVARKFRNLMIFGCWWFLNNPSIIDEMTRERVELLGLSMIPQHSDARVLDQLIYKWKHSRKLIGDVLVEKYREMNAAGWPATADEIRRDVHNILGGGTFLRFLGKA